MADLLQKQLWDAAWNGDLEKAKDAISKNASINALEEYGGSALHKAAGQGHFEIVELLINHGAEIEILDGVDMAPVMSAAVAGQVGIVRYLVEKGAKLSYDLMSSVQMKVNILEENAESGMVRPEAVEAWKEFMAYLVSVYQQQNP